MEPRRNGPRGRVPRGLEGGAAPVKSLSRGLDLLDAFAERPRRHFAELAAATRIPRSSLYRFLALLAARGFLRQDPLTSEYSPGPVLYRPGSRGAPPGGRRRGGRGEFGAEVERIRRQGWAYSEAELASGAWAVAVPILDRTKTCVASLVVAGPMVRLERERLPEYARLLRAAVADLTRSL